MIFAAEGDGPGLAQDRFALGARGKVDTEAAVFGRGRVAEDVMVLPYDDVARLQVRGDRPELHLVHDDDIGVRRGCRRGRRRKQQRYPCCESDPEAHHYFRLAERCSACFWCSLNKVRPVSSNDLSSALLAEGIR